jgi:hypothetical protein
MNSVYHASTSFHPCMCISVHSPLGATAIIEFSKMSKLLYCSCFLINIYATTIYCSMSSGSLLLLLLDDLLRTRFGTQGSQCQGIIFARGRSRGGGLVRKQLTTRLATRRSFPHESRAKLGFLYDFPTPPLPLLSSVTVLYTPET